MIYAFFQKISEEKFFFENVINFRNKFMEIEIPD
jgi:hypothetical protein